MYKYEKYYIYIFITVCVYINISPTFNVWYIFIVSIPYVECLGIYGESIHTDCSEMELIMWDVKETWKCWGKISIDWWLPDFFHQQEVCTRMPPLPVTVANDNLQGSLLNK